MGFIWTIVLIVYTVVSCGLIFLILIQQSKGEGLAGAFGGGGGSQTLFGASTPHVLQRTTIYLAIAFILLGFVISFRTPKVTYDGEMSGVVGTSTTESTTEAGAGAEAQPAEGAVAGATQ